jgi:hypothetical protein
MAEKGGTKIITIVTIIIILLSISITWYIINENKNDSSYFLYQLEIYADSSTEYLLYFPIALNNYDKEHSVIMDYIKIENGQGNFSLINTIKGDALEVIGQGNLEVISEKTKVVPYAILSMSNESVNLNDKNRPYYFDFWIYRNSSNSSKPISFFIDLYVWHDSENKAFDIRIRDSFPIQLDEGWNLIYFELSEIT